MTAVSESVSVQETVQVRCAYLPGAFFEDRGIHPGQPTRLTKRLAEAIYFLAKRGLVDDEISYVLQISVASLNKWKRSKTFAQALDAAKDEIDDRVERAFLRRCLGYRTTERRVDRLVNEDGRSSPIRISDTEKDIPPDARAGAFWLAHRRPERWGPPPLAALAQESVPVIGSTNADREELVRRFRAHFGEDADRVAQELAIALDFPIEVATNRPQS